MDDEFLLDTERMRLRADCTTFLVGGDAASRVVLVHGEPGIGVTTFIDLLHADVLMRGVLDVVSIDSDSDVAISQKSELEAKLHDMNRARIIVAVHDLDTELVSWLEARCELRICEVPALDRASARAMLDDLGCLPWSLAATSMIDAAHGNPSRLMSLALATTDDEQVDWVDETLERAELPSGLTAWLSSQLEGETGDRERLVASAEAVVARGMRATGDLVDHLHDAYAVLAEAAWDVSDFGRAAQLADRSAANLPGRDAELLEPGIAIARRWSALVGCAARARRGEATAMLALHARAGSASRAGLVILEVRAWQLIAHAALDAGDLGTALRATTRAIDLADGVNAVGLGLVQRTALAQFERVGGTAQRAVGYLDEVIDTAHKLRLRRVEADATALRAQARADLGEHQAARDDARAALIIATHVRDRAYRATMRIAVARLLASLGDLNAAIEVLGSPPPDDVGLAPEEVRVALEAVRILGHSGIDTPALVRWASAVLRDERTIEDASLRAARAEVDAWYVATSGRFSEASRLAQRAVALWLDSGSHDDAQAAELLVQRAPLPYGPRIELVTDPDTFAPLTPREREIARFVATGLTNPEIASELHLSPRTVEHHVGAILRKLEMSSRRELVRGRV
ncbi:MAG: LuxR family transcriptional regulator [Thermoleophilia bacterium]|nr:LuxR family transcriptional regulator [Thermoleophilia bacterium]